jgi:pseudaminic acid synthase
MKYELNINGRMVGPDYPVYIIAELSANHAQDFDHTVRTVRAMKAAGADAVKVQTYTPDTLTIQSDLEYFQIGGGTLWDGRTLYDLYSEAYMPWEWQPKLKALADELRLQFFSTPFDRTAVDFLEQLNVPAYKIASFELVDLPLICTVSHTGKPLIMSTGMASEEEISEAVAAARDAGCAELALLKCTSAYPALPEEMNLRTIPDLAKKFHVVPGLSDHTLGTTVSVAAVSLGACIVEKHFTLSRQQSGPDAAFSLEPYEFKVMVDDIRTTEKALGRINYAVSPNESKNRMFRRSLFVVKDVKTGEPFTEENLRSIRPGNGLHTRHLSEVLERKAAQDVKRGTPLKWEHVARA